MSKNYVFNSKKNETTEFSTHFISVSGGRPGSAPFLNPETITGIKNLRKT